MKIKRFYRHTRPKGKKQLTQNIIELDKQIKYQKSIGYLEDIEWLINFKKKCIEALSTYKKTNK